MDYVRRGWRCKITRPVRKHGHLFRGHEEGVILGETDNGLGQKIASVEWDEGNFGPVFSDEIDILEEKGG